MSFGFRDNSDFIMQTTKQTTNYNRYNRLTVDDLVKMFKQINLHVVQHTTGFDCWITDYAPCGRSPRRQISFKAENYACSLVMGLYQQRVVNGDRDYDITVGHEASHRCHNCECVNPSHLTFEEGDYNRTRACCDMFGKEPGYFCPHFPHCINAVQFLQRVCHFVEFH